MCVAVCPTQTRRRTDRVVEEDSQVSESKSNDVENTSASSTEHLSESSTNLQLSISSLELYVYRSIQDESPVHTMDLSQSLVTICGPWSLSVISKSDFSFVYLKSQSAEVCLLSLVRSPILFVRFVKSLDPVHLSCLRR